VRAMVALIVLAVVTAFAATPSGQIISSGPAPVSSVFGRTGAIVAAANDYSFSQLSGTATDAQLASAYSGAGGCAASNFASALTRNAAPTCSPAVTESVINWGDIGGGSTGSCANVAVTSFAGCGADWFWANAHTLTRVKITMTAGAGCVGNGTVAVRDTTGATNLSSTTFANAAVNFDSGAISVATTAAHDFVAGITAAATSCTTNPSLSTIKVTYQ